MTFIPSFLLVLSCFAAAVHGEITLYNVQGAYSIGGSGTTTTVAPTSSATTGAFNNVVLTAPAVPSPAQPTALSLSLYNSPSSVQNLSIEQSGSFMGFSIEMSVITQVIGINSSYINPPFLNLMALVTERAGRVYIRMGGNTQETATLVDSLPDGSAIEKDKEDSSNPTETPTLIFTPEILYLLANVSSLLPVQWYLGIPFNDTTKLRLGIAEYGERILGDNLVGFQVGNEPDLYINHDHRPANYTQWDYYGEFGVVVDALQADSNVQNYKNLIAPSVSGTWSPESVWNTGFIPAYQDDLYALAVEHYPTDNCAAAYPDSGFGDPIDPQEEFSVFLTHASGVGIVEPYLNSTSIAVSVGKPFLMFETNSASCGGFPGLSDSYGAALWALDYGLQMAYSNFSGALLHVGGRDVSYNPFTPPPTNESSFHEWTIGPVFYSVLAVAETLGKSNTSQIVDLSAQINNDYMPGYAVYENDALARVALFNYVTDATGASDYTATISVGGSALGESNGAPASVKVKRLAASTTGEKFNITWAGQTLGDQYGADGRFQGTETIEEVSCDQTANTCAITVPAPGFALVFFSDAALSDSEPTTTETFSTTAVTKTLNTATVDASALATSNGERAGLSSTSKGSSGAAGTRGMLPGAVLLGAVAAGMGLILGGRR